MMDRAIPPSWADLQDEIVVLDLRSSYVYVGRLVVPQGEYLLLGDADVHDLRDTTATRDQYVLQCRRLGITANRRWVWINAQEIVGVSRLADVIVE
jgi:hypothetical protein